MTLHGGFSTFLNKLLNIITHDDNIANSSKRNIHPRLNKKLLMEALQGQSKNVNEDILFNASLTNSTSKNYGTNNNSTCSIIVIFV